MKTYIDILRHGNAMKEPITGVVINDKLRPLSQRGIAQAIGARMGYNNDEIERIKLVLHSGAPRALCTAAIIAAGTSARYAEVSQFWPERTDPHYGKEVWNAFDKYGYDLEGYLRDETATQALLWWGLAGAARVQDEAHSLMTQDDDSIVIAAGHAVVSNFVAFELANHTEELLHIPLGEAERIRLVFKDGDYVGFERQR